jgi:hypothetical protein
LIHSIFHRIPTEARNIKTVKALKKREEALGIFKPTDFTAPKTIDPEIGPDSMSPGPQFSAPAYRLQFKFALKSGDQNLR